MCARCSAGRRGINCWYCQSKGDILKANLSLWLILQVVERVWNKGYMGVGRCPAHLRQQNQEQKCWCMARAEAGAAVTAEQGLSSPSLHTFSTHSWPLTSDPAIKYLRRGHAPKEPVPA